MPVYTYRCNKCSEEFDLLEGVNAQDEDKACKKCRGTDLTKVFAPFGVSIKSSRGSPGPSCGGCHNSGCPHSS